MSHIKSKDTSIEMMVRRRLFAMGYRYRVNYKHCRANPILSLPRRRNSHFHSRVLLARA